MPATCNPRDGDVGDDLSFVMPNYCSAGRDDDPKKLSSAQQSDDVSNAGRPPWSDVVGPIQKLPSKRRSEFLFIKKMNSGRIRSRAENRSEK